MDEKNYLSEEEEIEEMTKESMLDENGYIIIDDSTPNYLPPDIQAIMNEYEKNGLKRLIELGLSDEDGYYIECNDDRWKKLLEDDND